MEPIERKSPKVCEQAGPVKYIYDDVPFERMSCNDVYWGHWVQLDIESSGLPQRQVWVQNPRFKDFSQEEADWDDLWGEHGVKIEWETGEEEGWIEDLIDSVLGSLEQVYG